MSFRRFTMAYRYTDSEGRNTLIPRGWAGDLDDKVAAVADEAGATVLPAPEPALKGKSSDK